MLHGRQRERATLDGLLNAVRAGESRALVIEGEAGVGKSALLDHLRERATGCRVTRAAGVQSEMELAFAGLHQLCAPMLDRLDRLPGPQRDALATAFGLARAEAPDRFFVGLAVLSLLSEVADERPLVCIVDDAQWLDLASVETLGFVARRLLGESVALVFAVRDGIALETLTGLPRMHVEGLSPEDAGALLRSVILGPLDERVAERIVAETRGNPLALLELPRGLSTAQLAGGFGLPVTGPLAGRIERSFQRRLEELPSAARWLLLIAAAEPVGDPSLVWRAARRLGIDAEEAAATTTAADLVTLGTHVRFRHPLARSAVYRGAPMDERRAVHEALAEETDAATDPDRRAWHRAQAAAGPDDTVAAELERSAGRAQARGGLAAAAAFLERAMALTGDARLRTRRALAAAQAAHDAGACDAASVLLTTAERGTLDELDRARAERLRARIGLTRRRGSAAPKLFLRAAQRLEPLDAELARETYFEALGAALTTGHRAMLDEAVQALRRPPGLQTARAAELVMIGQALMVTEDRATATPVLKRALEAFRSEPLSGEDELRALAFACIVAVNLWDDEAWVVLSARHVGLARDAGALAVLPIALELHAAALVMSGRLQRRADPAGRGRRDRHGDRQRAADRRRAAARGLAGRRGARARPDRGCDRRRLRTRRGEHGHARRVRRRLAVQRAGTLRLRAGRRTAVLRAARSPLVPQGPGRDSGGRRPQRRARRRRRRARAAAGRDGSSGHGLGARHRAAHARAAQRRPGSRRAVPRRDRAARPHPRGTRARARPPAVRRVATPRPATRGRPLAPARRPRGVRRDGRPGVRGSRRARAARDGRDRAQTRL